MAPLDEDIEKNPRTVIISTHLIDEVTNLFEEIIILKDKKVYLNENVESLMQKSYFLNGRLENIEPFIVGKNIISQEDFGSSTILGVFDNLSKSEKDNLKKNGVDISSIPLQKLFILLTEKKIKDKEVI